MPSTVSRFLKTEAVEGIVPGVVHGKIIAYTLPTKFVFFQDSLGVFVILFSSFFGQKNELAYICVCLRMCVANTCSKMAASVEHEFGRAFFPPPSPLLPSSSPKWGYSRCGSVLPWKLKAEVMQFY